MICAALGALMVFAHDVGVNEVIFKGDSLKVCNALHGRTVAPTTVNNVIVGTLCHLQGFRRAEVAHFKKEGSKSAHILAHHANLLMIL